jgi:hypothetical protein
MDGHQASGGGYGLADVPVAAASAGAHAGQRPVAERVNRNLGQPSGAIAGVASAGVWTVLWTVQRLENSSGIVVGVGPSHGRDRTDYRGERAGDSRRRDVV